MAVLYKNEGQIEFARLYEQLKEAKNFSPADVARLLGVSRATVSKNLSGKASPGPRTLEVFRIRVREQLGENPPEVQKPNRVREQLEYLKENDPSSYDVARQMISVLHDKAVSSVRLSEDEETGLSHAAAAKKLAQESEQKQKVVAPSANRRAPGGAAGKGKK